jgi:NADPH:quinone reductase-like Zn-dependent oxidoreductase
VKSLGADHVFDAYDPEVGKKIREFTSNKLYYAWDCIGENGSTQQCADALADSSPSGQSIYYGSITKFEKFPREDAVVSYSIGYSAEGEDWEIGWEENTMRIPGNIEHLEWMKKWTVVVEKLAVEGKWKPHRQEVRSGGFEGILQGLEDLKNGKVSGAKLTYRVADP